MSEYILYLVTAVIVSLSMFVSNLAMASGSDQGFELHAKMVHQLDGPVDNTDAYLQLVADKDGNQSLNVMFSNRSHFDGARFNARVRLFNQQGEQVREMLLDSRIGAPKNGEAIERMISRELGSVGFASVEADFYLSDFLYPVTAEIKSEGSRQLN